MYIFFVIVGVSGIIEKVYRRVMLIRACKELFGIATGFDKINNRDNGWGWN